MRALFDVVLDRSSIFLNDLGMFLEKKHREVVYKRLDSCRAGASPVPRVSPRVSAFVRGFTPARPSRPYQVRDYIDCSVKTAVNGTVPTITATETSSVPRSPSVSVS